VNEQARFRGRFTALLTMAGVAIGLGNIWRFPYMMGQNGGSAFLLIYLAMMLLIAIPALAGEWALARHTRSGTIGALEAAMGSSWGRAIGILLVAGILIADCYYMVVIGNILYAGSFSVMAGFSASTAEAYGEGLENGFLQYGFALVILAWALFVVLKGLNRGIEAVSRLFVPLFGLVMIYLVGFTWTLDGAPERLMAFLQPDFSVIGPREIFAALGQACFSLGIGGTLMLVYGSYLHEDENLISKAILTGLGDTGAALLAGLFIVPAVLVFGMSMSAGPTLIFFTLPELFAQLPAGRLVGSLFLMALTLMAFLSAVAGLQVCYRGAAHLWRQANKSWIVGWLGLVSALMMVPVAMNPDLIEVLDLIFGSGFLMFGSAMAVLGLAWGFGPEVIRDQLGQGPMAGLLIYWLRLVVPLALIAVLIMYIVENTGL
jgi:NSS family neurotransmitter:Na+ symporter